MVWGLQALVLEIQSMDFRTGDSKIGAPVEISGVGFHGLLPKLDFFMLAEYFFRIDARAKVQLPWRPTPLLQAVQTGLSKVDTGKYGDKLLGMLSFLGMQVGGNPDGAHAAFKDYAVDAVTARIGVRAHCPAPVTLPSACMCVHRGAYYVPEELSLLNSVNLTLPASDGCACVMNLSFLLTSSSFRSWSMFDAVHLLYVSSHI